MRRRMNNRMLCILLCLSAALMSGCGVRIPLAPLPDPPEFASVTELPAQSAPPVTPFQFSVHYTQLVADPYSGEQKPVQISGFYPVDFSQKHAEISMKAVIVGQGFSDENAQHTHFCLADGELCTMQQDGAESVMLTAPYRVGNEICMAYDLQLEGQSAPLLCINICTDRSLPQTEPEWVEWSSSRFFVNAELLAASGEPEPVPRQNTPAQALHPQRIPLQNQECTTVLRMSDAESEQGDFPEKWRLQMRNGQPLYLYRKAPSASCSLILLIDGAPVNVFDGKYAADLDNQPSAELWRIPVMLPDTLNGQHDAVLLLFDRMEQQMITGTPVILNCGGDT